MPDWRRVGKMSGSSLLILGLLTAYFEGDSLTPYRDVTGIATNCQGNTHGVDINKVMTPEECQVVDLRNKNEALRQLRSSISTPLTRNQEVAFSDFIYNEGIGTFKKSSMHTLIESGYPLLACKMLLKYKYAGGVVYSGLEKRRDAEYTICIME